MPKPAIGKSRPKQPEDISQPVFLYTDAVPRGDLRSLDNSSRNRPVQSTDLDFQRPKTPARHGQNKGSTHAPDLQKPLPPLKPPVRNHATNLSENTIGIALGSPRLVQSQSAPPQERTRKTQGKRRPVGIDKSGKWKKIRNLFKAKEALASPPPQPFYQLDMNHDWLAQDSTCSVDMEAQKVEEASEANDKADKEEDEWPMVNPDEQAKEAHAVTSDQVQKPEPMLQIDIPDVQLPRYSVMFSGLLGPHSRRSIRRSKVPPILATGHAASYSEVIIVTSTGVTQY